jgi:hypothetical protein
MNICIWCKQPLSNRSRLSITHPYQPDQIAEIHCDCVIAMVRKLCDINMAHDPERTQNMNKILDEMQAMQEARGRKDY